MERGADGRYLPRHGMYQTRLYHIWEGMKARCDRPSCNGYEYYGAKGISYCSRWGSFENFYEDMGASYRDGLSLERLNTMLDYSKENCEWVPMVTQAQHRRKPKSGRSSKYKGVSFNKDMGKYKGTLKFLGKHYHLGYDDCEETLARKYDELLIKLSGDVEGTNLALGLLI